jgi:hypothetical protein
LRSVASSEVCRVVTVPGNGRRGSRPWVRWGKATEAVKPWEAQPSGTLRRRGHGTQGESNEGTGEALLGRGQGAGPPTERESEPGIVLLTGAGQQNPPRGKARQPDNATRGGLFGE